LNKKTPISKHVKGEEKMEQTQRKGLPKRMTSVDKWIGHIFSSGCVTGEDYRTFQRVAKRDLKKQAEAAGFCLKSFQPGHYFFSAVLQNETTGNFIYVSIRDVRGGNSWYNSVLYRTMKHEKDWSGGSNRYCKWCDIVSALSTLQKKGENNHV